MRSQREKCRKIDADAGRIRLYRPDGDSFKVNVRILGTRNSYGTDHFLIEPLDGVGQRWTTSGRLSPVEE